MGELLLLRKSNAWAGPLALGPRQPNTRWAYPFLFFFLILVIYRRGGHRRLTAIFLGMLIPGFCRLELGTIRSVVSWGRST